MADLPCVTDQGADSCPDMHAQLSLGRKCPGPLSEAVSSTRGGEYIGTQCSIADVDEEALRSVRLVQDTAKQPENFFKELEER